MSDIKIVGSLREYLECGDGLVKKAEDYCRLVHSGQKRKDSNEPYSNHPFAVRGILVKYGYKHVVTQCRALLHDVCEDGDLSIKDIYNKFGFKIALGLFILSRNKGTKENQTKLSNGEYKQRLVMARKPDIIRVKIADNINITRDLETLTQTAIESKIRDAEEFYNPLGKKIAPEMVKELIFNINKYYERLEVGFQSYNWMYSG